MAIKRKRTMAYRREAVAVEHTGFYPYLRQYFEAIKVQGFSQETAIRRESDLRRFIGWCDERSLNHPNQITKPILEAYQRHLHYYRQERNGQPLSASSQNRYLSNVKQFFKWLARENHLLYNPASELQIIKPVPSLPVVLSETEIEQLMHQPDTNKVGGLRDRAILELFYSSGLRRSELCNLKLEEIALPRKTLYVRKGKGNKDRLIPIGERATYWLKRYLLEARDQLLIDAHESHFFINDYGTAFRDNKLGDKVKRYLRNAGIQVPGSCHLLRHAMATHMMENGADVRFIQAMLGHADLNSTQIYTHVSIRKLQEVHAETHPATMQREKEALLTALAAESDEDQDDDE
jgi:integrase/recombinase XerD